MAGINLSFSVNDKTAQGLSSAKKHITDTIHDIEREGRSLEDVFKDIQKAAAATFMGFSAAAFAKEVFNVRKEFQALEISFSTLLGSAEKGKKMFNDITAFATSTPMLEKDLAKGAQTLLGFGIEAERIMPLLQQIGDISMGDSQAFQSLTLAFAQATSTGKLMGQDFLQMVGQGFNPLQEMARTTGKSMAELKEDMSAGKISAEMLAAAFKSATDEGGKFHDMLKNKANSMEGAYSNLQGAMQKMFNEIGVQVEEPLIEGMNLATEAVNLLAENMRTVGDVVLGVAATFGTYKAACLLVAAATKAYAMVQGEATLQMALAKAAGETLTMAQAKDIAVTNLLTAAKARLTASVKALTGAMLANPYAIVAAAVVALISAIVIYNRRTNEATEAQKRLAEAQSNMEAETKKEIDGIDKLFNALRKAKMGTTEYDSAKRAILTKYPEYLNKLSKEALELGKVEDAYKAVTAAAKEAARARALEKVQGDIYNNYGEEYGGASQQLYGLLKQKIGAKNATGTLKAIRKELDKTGDISEKTRKKIEAVFDDLPRSYRTSASTLLGLMKNATKQLKDELEAADAAFAPEETADGGKATETKNKKYWEDKKKEKQAELDALTDIEAKGKKGEALKKQIQEYDAKLKAYDAKPTKTTGKTADQRASAVLQQQVAEYNLNEKYARERERQQQDIADRLLQQQIDLMQEGEEKTLAQMQLNHDKEMLQLDREEEDAIQAEIERQRALFDAAEKEKAKGNSKYAVKVFGEGDIDMDALRDLQDVYQSLRDSLTAKQQKDDADYNQLRLQSMYEYLQKYGTAEQQRYAIAAHYDKLIAQEGDKWKKEALKNEKKDAINKNDTTRMLERIDMASVFSDYGMLVSEPLKQAVKDLREYTKSNEFRKLNPTDQKSIIDALDKAESKIGSSLKGLNFKKAGADIDAYTKAVNEARDAENAERAALEKLKEARIAYNNALKSGNKDEITKAGITLTIAEKGATSATAASQKAAENERNAQNTAAESSRKLAEALNDVEKMAQGLASGSMAQLYKSLPEKTQNSIANAIAKALGAKSDFFSQIIGAVLSILDILKDGIGKLLQGLIESIGDAIGGILKNVLTGDLFVQVYDGLRHAVTSILDGVTFGGFSSWFDTGNAAEVAATTERLTKANEVLADRISDLSDAIGSSAGAKAITAYQTALDAQEQINKNNLEILQAQMGYNSAHHSNQYYADDKKIASYNPQAQRAFAAAGLSASTITGLSSIYGLTPEQLKAIKDFAPDLWKYLTEVGKYDKSEFWEQYISQAGKAEELTEKINDNLTQTSFDSLRGGFLDALTDMRSSSADFARDLEDMMFKAVVNSTVLNDEFDTWLKQWQKDYAKAVQDSDQGALQALQREYLDRRDQMIEERNSIAAAMGYSGTSSTAQATVSSAMAITEDTANDLVGRVTAVQIAVERDINTTSTISEQMALGLQHWQQMADCSSDMSATLNSLLEQHVRSNELLYDIAQYNKAMYTGWNEKINSIAQNTKKL